MIISALVCAGCGVSTLDVSTTPPAGGSPDAGATADVDMSTPADMMRVEPAPTPDMRSEGQNSAPAGWRGPTMTLAQRFPVESNISLQQYEGANIILLTVSEQSQECVDATLRSADGLEPVLRSMGYDTYVVLMLVNDGYEGVYEPLGLPTLTKDTAFLEEIALRFHNNVFELGNAYVFAPDGRAGARLASSFIESSRDTEDFASKLAPHLKTSR